MVAHSSGRTRVKICGITNAADRDVAVDAGADAVGVISGVSVETPREVEGDEAADLVAGVPPFVTAVLVTMPADVSEAVSVQDRVGADALQVHGSLEPDEIETLRNRIDVPVIVAIDAGAEVVDAYADVADALLVDSTDDEGAGGTGETHDWEQTRKYVETLNVPVVLAGGLHPENVSEGAETVEPFAVDVASGVERAGGQKDHEKVRAFVEAVDRTGVITSDQ